MKRASLLYLTGRENDAGELAQEPLAGEAGDGCEGGRGEAHDHVGDGHVDHEQVDPGVKTGRPHHGDHDEEVPDSPNGGDQAVEDEESNLDLPEEDDLLTSEAATRATVRSIVHFQASYISDSDEIQSISQISSQFKFS